MGQTLEQKRAYMRAWSARNREALRAYRRERYLLTKHITGPKKNAAGEAHRRLMRERLADVKTAVGCIKCGERDARCLDFHHRNENEKTYSIAAMGRRAWTVIEQEITKCDVICSNCHRKLHGGD